MNREALEKLRDIESMLADIRARSESTVDIIDSVDDDFAAIREALTGDGEISPPLPTPIINTRRWEFNGLQKEALIVEADSFTDEMTVVMSVRTVSSMPLMGLFSRDAEYSVAGCQTTLFIDGDNICLLVGWKDSISHKRFSIEGFRRDGKLNIIGVRIETGKEIALYLNGKSVVGTKPVSESFNDRPLFIGAHSMDNRKGEQFPQHVFRGQIEQFVMWNEAIAFEANDSQNPLETF